MVPGSWKTVSTYITPEPPKSLVRTRILLDVGFLSRNRVFSRLKDAAFLHEVEMVFSPIAGTFFQKSYGIIVLGSLINVEEFLKKVKEVIR